MNRVIINGVTYEGGRNISVSNNKVTIDGKDVTPKDTLEVNINVEGSVENLKVDYAKTIIINENVEGYVQTSSGDVEVGGFVAKGIQTTSGDVEVEGNVTGNVQTTSGDVKCKKVEGNVNTLSGDIKHKK